MLASRTLFHLRSFCRNYTKGVPGLRRTTSTAGLDCWRLCGPRRSERRIASEIGATLWRGLDGSDLGCGLREMKLQDPYAGGGLTIHLCRLESPALCGLQSQFGEILTWSRRVEGRIRNIAAWINRDPYPHLDFALNGLTRTSKYVGQNSPSDRTLHRHTFRGLSLRNWRLRWGRGDREHEFFPGCKRWLNMVRSQ